MSEEKEKSKAYYILVGAGLMFLLCLGIGLLDQAGMLDPILDALHVP